MGKNLMIISEFHAHSQNMMKHLFSFKIIGVKLNEELFTRGTHKYIYLEKGLNSTCEKGNSS